MREMKSIHRALLVRGRRETSAVSNLAAEGRQSEGGGCKTREAGRLTTSCIRAISRAVLVFQKGVQRLSQLPLCAHLNFIAAFGDFQIRLIAQEED